MPACRRGRRWWRRDLLGACQRAAGPCGVDGRVGVLSSWGLQRWVGVTHTATGCCAQAQPGRARFAMRFAYARTRRILIRRSNDWLFRSGQRQGCTAPTGRGAQPFDTHCHPGPTQQDDRCQVRSRCLGRRTCGRASTGCQRHRHWWERAVRAPRSWMQHVQVPGCATAPEAWRTGQAGGRDQMLPNHLRACCRGS